MGTSTNQPSPDSTIWAVVSACYESDIPLEKTATFLWRAIATQNDVFVRQLKSETVASLVRQPVPTDRISTDARVSGETKHTFVAELANRSRCALHQTPGMQQDRSLSCLFRQLTAYFVARDISGYVGPNFRCKTFAEVTRFKNQLGDVVASRVRQLEDQRILTPLKWSHSISTVLKKLSHP
jgi:hypothetical protein